MKQPNNYKV